FVYSLTIVFFVSFLVSFYFYLKYDYSLFFPAYYFQSHDYLFVVFALIILGTKFSQQGLNSLNTTKRDKLLISISLVLITLMIAVPTSEKIADHYQYRKAEEILTTDENDIDAVITHDVS